MQIISRVIYSILLLLTTIGEVTIFIFSFLWNIVLTLKNLVVIAVEKVGKIKRPKRGKKSIVAKSGRFPLGIKLKYFILGALFSFVFIFLPSAMLIIRQNVPDPHQLGFEQFPQTTKIYDRHNRLLFQIYGTQNRTLVPLSRVPMYLQQATIAIEDKNFYSNPGFDIVAIVRAGISDITGGKFQGGSTITQQLVKSSLLTPQISISRKVEEIILAFWTERLYAKKKILELYFNEVPYGGTAWGVEAAAQTYFGKNVDELDLAQCAFLAGLPQGPTLYSPFGTNHLLWKIRQKDVLFHMQELGYISKEQERQADEENLVFEKENIPLIAPHFVWYIKDLLVQKYGLPTVEKGGLSVVTSLNIDTQQMAQQTVANEIGKDGYLLVSNGALVVANPQNGDILAMVGSKDYNNPDFGNVNSATSLRQPGSSIKIITYAAALSKGFTPATILDDSPISFPLSNDTLYSPVNYDGRFHGLLSLRIALANSLNIPAVKTLNTIGIPSFIDFAHKMGVTSLGNASNYGLSLTLGAGEVTMLDMATAYGTLANGGFRVDLNPILKVTDYKGNVLEEKKAVTHTSVLDNGVAFILSDILADNNARSMEFGPNSPLVIPGHFVSVKTGTSDSKRDNWTIGYTKDYVITVWVGNNDNSPMSQDLASGITGAAPIWHTVMTNLLLNKPDEKPAQPTDVIAKPCLGRIEYFIRGTENSVDCNFKPLPTPSPTPKPQ